MLNPEVLPSSLTGAARFDSRRCRGATRPRFRLARAIPPSELEVRARMHVQLILDKEGTRKPVPLHGPEAFAAMRRAGRLAAETLDFVTPLRRAMACRTGRARPA